MYVLEKIKDNLAKQINEVLAGDYVSSADFAYPPNENFGDLSLPCFELAKKTGQPAPQLIGKLISALASKEIIASVKAAGPYLNFGLDKAEFAKQVLSEIAGCREKFGFNQIGNSQKTLVEFSNVNTHKEYHIGHLRNLCFGDSITRLLTANGFNAIPISYVNDFGIHAAKTIWCYLEDFKNKPLPENKGYFLGKIYVQATNKLEGDQIGKSLVGLIMKKIEGRQGEEYQTWQTTRQWSIEQFEKIYQDLDIGFDQIFYESEFIDQGREMVEKMLAEGVLARSQGAVIADLEKENLGVLMFLRSDGTALYPVADLPLALEKAKRYQPQSSIYIIDIRQSLYMKQLFSLLKKLGYPAELRHLAYDFVKLKSGMMSSRSGNVVTYEELKEESLANARQETEKRHSDWPAEKIEQTAWGLIKATLKFEMIKVSSGQTITYDTDQALRFDGYTAPYILYSRVRIKSLLRNSGGGEASEGDYSLLVDPKETALILKMAKYPEAVKSAGEALDPSVIARYLFDLAQLFNDYYHSVPILKSDEETRKARLDLADTAGQVLENGLAILGIQILEEM